MLWRNCIDINFRTIPFIFLRLSCSHHYSINKYENIKTNNTFLWSCKIVEIAITKLLGGFSTKRTISKNNKKCNSIVIIWKQNLLARIKNSSQATDQVVDLKNLKGPNFCSQVISHEPFLSWIEQRNLNLQEFVLRKFQDVILKKIPQFLLRTLYIKNILWEILLFPFFICNNCLW